MTESELLQQIRLTLGRKLRLFRNNVGQAWVGQVHRRGQEMWIKNPRVLHAGLCEGSSDLIGWKSITVTPDMVGKKVAVFTAIEVKKPGRDTTQADHLRRQQAWIDAVVVDGGIGRIVRSEEELIEVLK